MLGVDGGEAGAVLTWLWHYVTVNCPNSLFSRECI